MLLLSLAVTVVLSSSNLMDGCTEAELYQFANQNRDASYGCDQLLISSDGEEFAQSTYKRYSWWKAKLRTPSFVGSHLILNRPAGEQKPSDMMSADGIYKIYPRLNGAPAPSSIPIRILEPGWNVVTINNKIKSINID